MKKRAFIKYTEYGKIIPGSMIVTNGSFPSKEGRAKWYEVPMDKCCSSGPFNIEAFLSRMNTCYTQVTDLVPNVVYFTDYSNDLSFPNYIVNGCDDMYDSGNMYNTNLTQLYNDTKLGNPDYSLNIPYTHTQDSVNDVPCNYINPSMNGFIADGTNYFGVGSHYFTNMYPGMFVLVADGVNVTEFSIVGELGSDGDGVNAAYIATSHPGWTAFVKTNTDTSEDPSVNHIILVYGDTSGVAQLYDDNGEYDDHCLQNLGSQNSTIIAAVVATEFGTPALTETQALAIADKILDVYNSTSCNSSPALNLLFNDIANANTLVGDSTSVSDWNTFFDLPTFGYPFTSVTVVGNTVKLYGGSNIKVKPALFYNQQEYLISVIDEIGCITSVGGDAFAYNNALRTVSLPACTQVFGYQDSPQNDYGGFGGCQNLININIPNLTIVGDYGFAAVGGNTGLLTFNFPLLTNIGEQAFQSCNTITSISFPLLSNIGNYAFNNCVFLTSISLPSCVNLGSTVGDDLVFGAITGNTITLTVPAALMTADAGNPDGDIVELQANNTVTIITV